MPASQIALRGGSRSATAHTYHIGPAAFVAGVVKPPGAMDNLRTRIASRKEKDKEKMKQVAEEPELPRRVLEGCQESDH